MRWVCLWLVVLALAACAPVHQPPTSADEQFSVVVYNRTQSPVFLFREVAACGSSRLTALEMVAASGPPPSGDATVGAVTIKTPRGYAGTVSIVVTADGAPTVTIGDVAEVSLPPCQGTR